MNQIQSPSAAMYGLHWLRAQREIACCRCRHRKKKCDKRRPVCGECSKSGAECVPLAPKKSAKQHPSAGYVHLLEKHVASLETRLRDTNPSIAGDHLMGIGDEGDSPNTFGSLVEGLTPQTESPAGLAGGGSPPSPAPLDQGPGIGRTDQSDWIFDSFGDHDALALPDRPPSIFPELLPYSPPIDCRFFDPSEEGIEELGAPGIIPGIDIVSTKLAKTQLSLSIASRYMTEYFMSAHPMWPFLHHRQWEDWWNYWTGPARDADAPDWRTFFVDIVVSIGGLLVHSQDPSRDHLEAATKSYHRAMAKYDSYGIQGKSPVLRTQSSLLLTVHAMHIDSAADLFTRATEAVKNCALSSLSHYRSRRASRGTEDHTFEDIVHKMTTRSCVVIDILISNTMDHSVCLDDSSVEDDETTDNDGESVSSEELRLSGVLTAHPSPSEIALEEHMFRLRRIQYRILRLTRKLEFEALEKGHPIPNLWRSRPKHNLDLWVQGIDTFSASAERQRRFKSAVWMLKLANYTVISLFPNPYLAVRGGDSKHLVAAACFVLIKFRELRVKDDTTCYTWTALLHQFQAGVTVAFCLWATPTHQQLSLYDRRDVCQAIFSCLATLIDFSNKWSSAQAFRETFELLTQAFPVVEFGDPTQQWSISPSQALDMKRMIATLEQLKVQRRVIDMLSRMKKGPRPAFTTPSIEETQWIQYEHSE